MVLRTNAAHEAPRFCGNLTAPLGGSKDGLLSHWPYDHLNGRSVRGATDACSALDAPRTASVATPKKMYPIPVYIYRWKLRYFHSPSRSALARAPTTSLWQSVLRTRQVARPGTPKASPDRTTPSYRRFGKSVDAPRPCPRTCLATQSVARSPLRGLRRPRRPLSPARS